jgi:hypothetical protein
VEKLLKIKTHFLTEGQRVQVFLRPLQPEPPLRLVRLKPKTASADDTVEDQRLLCKQMDKSCARHRRVFGQLRDPSSSSERTPSDH